MSIARDLGAFAAGAAWGRLSARAVDALKIRLLDALGCAYGALGAPPIDALGWLVDELGGAPLCSLITRPRSAPDRATLWNGALVRYLDFNDAYLAPGETCHPSDNVAPVLASAELARADGRALLVALAVAYQVQCRLSDVAPLRARGFDHTTHLACSAAAGCARALGIGAERATNAIAIAATISPALRVTRTGHLSNWKGLAAPYAAVEGIHAALFAARGITGPQEAFEGEKGFMDALSGRFQIDWSTEDLGRVTCTSLKRYDAEIHAQSTVEAVLDAVADPMDVAIGSIEVDTFGVAEAIIGGREKLQVRTKEEADHSLPYMVAVAALDHELTPAQYAPERIARDDVQSLLRRVTIRSDPALSARFPSELPCRVRITLANGTTRVVEKSAHFGFATRPMTWGAAWTKFKMLTANRLSPARQSRIGSAIAELESLGVGDLVETLTAEDPKLPDRPACVEEKKP